MSRHFFTIASRGGFLLAAAGWAAWMAYRSPAWFAGFQAGGALLLFAAGVAVTGGLIYAGLRGSAGAIRRLTIEGSLLVAVLIVVEIAIAHRLPQGWTGNPAARQVLSRMQHAEKLGVPFDERGVSEVVAELRSRGVDALPGIGRAWGMEPEVRAYLGEDLYPLSHASGAYVVECNESGVWQGYRTDEFGFNNPQNLLAAGQIDLAIVGESLALGHCVPRPETFASRLREVYPRTANFGMAATRSLSQLASLREYVVPLRPAVVLWVVNPGYAAPGPEATDPLLLRYLDPAHSQGLMQRQDEVDAAIRKLAIGRQAGEDAQLREEIERARNLRFDRTVKLQQVRSGLDFDLYRREHQENANLESFPQIMQLAAQAVQSWGGRLIVVVLPSYGLIDGHGPETLRYRGVLATLQDLDLETIDGAAPFMAHKDPRGLYALRARNHPNAQGHALLAQSVLERVATILPASKPAPENSGT